MILVHRNKWLLVACFGIMLMVSVSMLAQVAWVQDFDTALKRAAKEKKFIVLDMSASW